MVGIYLGVDRSKDDDGEGLRHPEESVALKSERQRSTDLYGDRQSIAWRETGLRRRLKR